MKLVINASGLKMVQANSIIVYKYGERIAYVCIY